ncbi:(4Fe-4S)-binding protein [Streptomyces niveus]|uniref:(4Fe-4S)-binding protein n=1 Tax=Streptomyces niveus TaxID=193462 RepID=UPI0036D3D3EA
MSGGTEKKAYKGRSITVTFEAGRCLHAAECVHGLPEVFDTGERPWIRPDRAGAERVAEVVRRSPSGALQYELVDGGAEPPNRPARITRDS